MAGEVDLPPALEHELYQIAQEALNNVIKHANAGAVTIQINGTDNQLCMTIRDDGVGFTPTATLANPGLGLRSMGERVQGLAGALVLQSALGAGTIVQVTVPYRTKPDSEQSSSEKRRPSA
jgi:signal transduction histidine kinase